MALFSPPIMARFEKVRVDTTSGTVPMFQFSGTVSEALALLDECAKDRTEAGSRCAESIRKHSNRWAGFKTASAHDMLEKGFSADALAAFEAANARLEAKGARAPNIFREAGGAWSVPRHLAGHPRAAFHRPRTALPAKHWHVASCFAYEIEESDIADPLAKLARAAWSYIQQGGTIALSVHYTARFSLPCDGMEGLSLNLRVPLTDISSIATACSVQFFRLGMLAFGQALSGKLNDSMPVCWAKNPGGIRLNGNRRTDAKELTSRGIE